MWLGLHNSCPGLHDSHWLQRHHNERDGVLIHRRLYCLLNRLFRCRSKKTWKLCVTGLCEGNPPMTDGLPSQRASNAENVSLSKRLNAHLSSTQAAVFVVGGLHEKWDRMLLVLFHVNLFRVQIQKATFTSTANNPKHSEVSNITFSDPVSSIPDYWD